jgi:glycosyltransferase involved in cell wall biosynthesis
VIPQKGIERDIRLLAALRDRGFKTGIGQLVLIICGDTEEDSREYDRLRSLSRDLNIDHAVFWMGAVSPLGPATSEADASCLPTMRALYSIAKMVTFLPALDYDTWGNPIGEAISFGLPFVTTYYHAYRYVYERIGIEGCLWRTNSEGKLLFEPPAAVVDSVQTILESAEIIPAVRTNLAKARREFGRERLEAFIAQQMDAARGARY